MSGTLFDAGSYRQQKLADFHTIPERVWPTPLWALHQDGDVLFYRNADAARGISAAQHRLFKALARVGDHVEDRGSQQVIVCTGLRAVTYDRQIAVYDHMHNDEKLRLEASQDEIAHRIGDWFKAREGR